MIVAKSPILRAVVIMIAAVVVCVVSATTLLVARSISRDELVADVRDEAGSIRLPWEPSLDEQYPSASECADCHPAQVEEWQASAHSRAATDPLVHASVCGRCHTPVGTQFDAEHQLKFHDGTVMPDVPAAGDEGVTCVTCHSPVRVPDEQTLTFMPTWPNWLTTDLALEVLPFDEARGTFGSGSADDPPPVANDSHPSVFDERVGISDLCKPCHEAVVDKAPLSPHEGLDQPKVRLLTTYSEWAASPYAESGETCQSCHMPRRERLGTAAVAPTGTEYEQPLPLRPLADHSLLGVSTEYLTEGPHVEQQEARAAGHVMDAASIDLHVPPSVSAGSHVTVAVAIENTGAGHDLPTGFAYWSEAWLEVVATDGDGRELLVSGDLDEDGWLRDEFNPRVVSGTLEYDSYLLNLRARLVSVGPNRARWEQDDGTLEVPPDDMLRNYNGTPIIGPDGEFALELQSQLYPDEPPPPAAHSLQEVYVLRFADTVLRSGIQSQAVRRVEYPVTVDGEASGPIRVQARLLIRALWPWMLQQQEELPTPRPWPKVYEIVSSEATVAIEP